MTRCAVLLSFLVALGCGASPEPTPAGGLEPSDDDVALPDQEPGPSEGGATATMEPAAEGAGLGDLVGRCRELVGGEGHYDTCLVDALVENASTCDELAELVECLQPVGPRADAQERARVLQESCPEHGAEGGS